MPAASATTQPFSSTYFRHLPTSLAVLTTFTNTLYHLSCPLSNHPAISRTPITAAHPFSMSHPYQCPSLAFHIARPHSENLWILCQFLIDFFSRVLLSSVFFYLFCRDDCFFSGVFLYLTYFWHYFFLVFLAAPFFGFEENYVYFYGVYICTFFMYIYFFHCSVFRVLLSLFLLFFSNTRFLSSFLLAFSFFS